MEKGDKLDTLFEDDQLSASTDISSVGRQSSSGSSDLPRTNRSNSWTRHSSSKERRLSKTNFSKGTKADACLNPFYLRWCYGLNTDVPISNLTTKYRPLIFYAASHVGIMYDYVAKEMRLLQGHKNLISTIAADGSGKWIVTADKGDDNTIIVWDSLECIPVNTIFDPHPDCGTALVGISNNAKYLISVSNEQKPVIKFWLWTYGNEQADDICSLETNSGRPLKVRFNPHMQEHIMICFERQIVFIQWNAENQKLSLPVIPSPKTLKKFGTITDCCYIEECHECIASTVEGYLLVFGNTSYRMPFQESEIKNNKLFAKAVRVSKPSITCIESVDGIIATGDVEGRIKFYDKTLRILYWCQNFALSAIKYISFNLEKRLYKFQDPLKFDDDFLNMEYSTAHEYQCLEKAEEYESFYAQLVPTDATLKRLPFIVRNFIVGTNDGQIVAINYIENKCQIFFKRADAPVAAIDTHDEEPYLCIAYSNGNISLYNYKSHEIVTDAFVPREMTESTGCYSQVSCIKYSPQSLHLACGKDNASLWFLDPILLTPKYKYPLQVASGKIIKIEFSLDCKYLAYYDDNSTVCLFKYTAAEDSWMLMGKLRSHYKRINDMMFSSYLPPRLFTIGDDRYLVEYDLNESESGELMYNTRERIEQTAIPVSFICYPPREDVADRYLYMSDNQFKYKMVHDITNMCRSVVLGPAYGGYETSCVRSMALLPQHENRYLIFANSNHFGIQMLPFDGNPYKFVGTIGHPLELRYFRTCYEGKHVFTFGKDDPCVLMWQVNVLAVQVMSRIGGVELEPFYCLIDGGINGWLFKEMQDLFYYMQILHEGENTVLPRVVNDHIPAAELPDLMRACGFYPSEYEIENLIIDIRYRDYDETKTLKEDVFFFEFVKLYVNHKPAHGISLAKLKNSFETFCSLGEGSTSKAMNSASFVESICQKGEIFTWDKAHTCLATLMHQKDVHEDDESINFFFLPEEIDFDTFIDDILGMDLDRKCIEDVENPDHESAEVEDEC